jgi:hypothetical protein
MAKYRKAAKIDKNQPKIVAELEKRPGVKTRVGVDDILVGYRGKTYWYEIKNPEYAQSKRTGKLLDSAKRDDQKKLDDEWTGHRETVFSVGEILADIGYQC